jgi:hypothetical protein
MNCTATARGDQLQVGSSKHRTRETGPVSSEGKRHSGNGIWSHIGMNALLGPRSGANTVCSYQYATQAHISELDKLCVILRDPLS